MQKYKLVSRDLKSHKGFQWEIGKEQIIDKPGTRLCSDQVFHYYDSPELAALFNPIHADIAAPRLFVIECDSVAHDGLKGGSKRQTLMKEIPLPEFSLRQRVLFAVSVALDAYPTWAAYDTEQRWKLWADAVLAGRPAESAAESARSAAWSAAESAAEELSISFQNAALKALSLK